MGRWLESLRRIREDRQKYVELGRRVFGMLPSPTVFLSVSAPMIAAAVTAPVEVERFPQLPSEDPHLSLLTSTLKLAGFTDGLLPISPDWQTHLLPATDPHEPLRFIENSLVVTWRMTVTKDARDHHFPTRVYLTESGSVYAQRLVRPRCLWQVY